MTWVITEKGHAFFKSTRGFGTFHFFRSVNKALMMWGLFGVLPRFSEIFLDVLPILPAKNWFFIVRDMTDLDKET